jgi:arylsulfatase A-like enzyme
MRIQVWSRFFLSISVPALVAWQGVISCRAQEKSQQTKPNIIVVVADDLGYGDVGFQGGKDIPTPNIDSLAKSGVKFTNAYVSCPVCSPTRAGLLTGRYQQRFGHEFNPGPIEGTSDSAKFGLPLTEVTLAKALKEANYSTGIIGKWHLGFDPDFVPTKRGFDEFFGFLGGAHPYVKTAAAPKGAPIYRGTEEVEWPEYLTDAFGDEAASFVDRHKDHPYFLYLTFNAVHNPAQATDKYLKRFEGIQDEKRRTYAAMLSALDDNLGKVLTKVRESGKEDNTIIFFVSDNGGPTKANSSTNGQLHGDKGTVWEGGIRVPYVIQWKGKLPAGKVYDKPVISLDISATAASAAGAKLGGGKPIDGVDLVPYVLDDSKTSPHESLFWRFGNRYAVRKGDYKLLSNADGEVQLYDLAKDISETTDLSANLLDVKADLLSTYAAWNSELESPRWQPGNNARQARRQDRASSINAPAGKKAKAAASN